MTQLETLPFKRGEPTANAGLRASLKAPDLQKRRRELLDRFEREGDPDVQLEMAFLEYMVHDFDAGLATAQPAYRGLRQQGRKRPPPPPPPPPSPLSLLMLHNPFPT